MKKILFMAVMAMAVSGFIFAQDDNSRPQNMVPGQIYERRAKIKDTAENITINGKLEWINGRIAVKTGGKTYFVNGIQPLLGFVDGLKEGAQVTLAGKSHNISYIPEYGFVRAEKVTFNNKEYKLSDDWPDFGGMPRRQHGGNEHTPGGMMFRGW